jgi:hypothetical protein
MAVNRTIAAKKKNDVGILARARHAHAPLDGFVPLKGLQNVRRTSQSEDGSRPHVRGRE